jgi:hypothetical protein
MKKPMIALTLVALLLMAGSALAEEKVLEVGKWYPSMEGALNMTQSSYSNNWSGGDKGTIVWALTLNAGLERQLNEGLNWNNTLKLAWGQNHNQNRDLDGKLNWESPEKSTDLIDFTTIFRLTHNWLADPYVSGRFESQFQDATDGFGRTQTMNPMIFSEAAGIARKLISEEERELMSRVGFSLRQSVRSFFSDDLGTGTDTISESANDGGIEWVTDYKTRILEERVSWTSTLALFQPLFFSGKSDLEDNEILLTAAGLDSDIADYTLALDVNWDNTFTTQITEHFTVNLFVQWKYDKYDNTVIAILEDSDDDGAVDLVANADALAAGVRKAGQFKQTLALGLNYRFF